MVQYQGQECPQCGCDYHYITNASMPTVYECCNCRYAWNPNVEPVLRKAKYLGERMSPMAIATMEENAHNR